jgi:ribosomal-protein-alanine N-acetyltransferase
VYFILEAHRLKIRPIILDDDVFILELVNSEGWLRFIGDRNVKNQAEAKSYIQKILDRPASHYGVIECKDTKRPMGIVTFLHRETQSYPDLGFALLPDFEGFGYAMEACQIFLDTIKVGLKIQDKIIAITKSDNVRSIHLIQKLGFQYFGPDAHDSQLSIYMIS